MPEKRNHPGCVPCIGGGPYLTELQRANIRKFKYAGSDEGIMYTYFYNPLATKLVEKCPDWLAPNTITLAGFSCSFIPFVAFFWIFGTHFYNEAP